MSGMAERNEVTEQREFQERNPDVAISSDEGGWHWSAQGVLANGRTAHIKMRSLIDVMDVLHRLEESRTT
jgi:hypothetical protein